MIMDKKLTEKTWWMVLWLIIFFPVGLYFLWTKHPEINKNIKIIITVIMIVLMVVGSFSKKPDTQQSTTMQENANNTISKTEQLEESTTKMESVSTEATTEALKNKKEIEKELSDLKGKAVKKGIDRFTETGYKIKYESQGVDFTDSIKDMDDMIIRDFDINESKSEIVIDVVSKETYEFDTVEEKGREWFIDIDWNNVFAYKSKVHYILDYSCQPTDEEFKKYGKYVAMASADLQNQYGAEFKSHVYIFMNKKGDIKHIFYDEATGESIEIDKENISMN